MNWVRGLRLNNLSWPIIGAVVALMVVGIATIHGPSPQGAKKQLVFAVMGLGAIWVMLLVPFLLIVGQWWLRRDTQDSDDSTARPALVIPWFAFGFLAMVVFNSLIALPAVLHAGLVTVGQVSLAMAMAALGFETRLEKLKALGVRPFLLALCLFVLLLGGGWALTPLLMS